ncbi:MAG: hypothetical protein HYS13_01955, partial [Planctomycetia bacterium]|nr:hypothetical protein [Planctomycetia bacterium]
MVNRTCCLWIALAVALPGCSAPLNFSRANGWFAAAESPEKKPASKSASGDETAAADSSATTSAKRTADDDERSDGQNVPQHLAQNAPDGEAARRVIPSDRASTDREIQEVLGEMAGLVPPETLRQLEADLRQVEPAQLPMVLRTCRAVCERLRSQRKEQQASAVADRIAQLANNATGTQQSSSPRGVEPATARTPWQTQVAPSEQVTGAKAAPPSSKQTAIGAAPIAAETERPPTTAWSPPGEPPVETTTGSTMPPAASHRAAQPNVSFLDPPPENDDWRKHLDRAILALETELPDAPRTPEESNHQARLRMMYLLAGRRADALRPIGGASPELEDFWTKQLYGLDTMLDVERNASPGRRAAESSRYLREAARRAGEMGPLVVRNLAFCTKIASFGQFERFSSDPLAPGQAVLLYAEL